MQLITKFNKGLRFLLCVIDTFSKYTWVVPLKDKKSITIINAFQKILDKSMDLHSRLWQSQSKGCKQTRYGSIKAVNFTIILLKNG